MTTSTCTELHKESIYSKHVLHLLVFSVPSSCWNVHSVALGIMNSIHVVGYYNAIYLHN